MKSKITSYPLINQGRQTIEMPPKAAIMTVKYNNAAGHALLYVLVDIPEPRQNVKGEPHEIIILTCDENFDRKDMTYIDTFCDQRGLFFHVFERFESLSVREPETRNK